MNASKPSQELRRSPLRANLQQNLHSLVLHLHRCSTVATRSRVTLLAAALSAVLWQLVQRPQFRLLLTRARAAGNFIGRDFSALHASSLAALGRIILAHVQECMHNLYSRIDCGSLPLVRAGYSAITSWLPSSSWPLNLTPAGDSAAPTVPATSAGEVPSVPDAVQGAGQSSASPNRSSMSTLGAALQQACSMAALAEVRQRDSLVSTPQSTPSQGDSLRRVTQHPFRENCWRLWTGEARNLETIQPFAHLSLTVNSIRLWETICSNVQVFVNDVLVHTSSMSGRFNVSLGIYSPFSIVRIAFMRERALLHSLIDFVDTHSCYALLGFVEVQVAELQPDGPELAGQFEVRTPDKFNGHADSRFQKHRQMRDDRLNAHCNKKSSTVSQCKPTRLRRRSNSNPLLPIQSERACASDEPPQRRLSDTNAASTQLNAGEVDMTMKLEVTSGPHRGSTWPHPSWLHIFLGAIFPQHLKKLGLPDEWHAYCFPRPTMIRTGHAEDRLYLKDLKDLHNELIDMNSVLLDQFLRKFAALSLYVFRWRCRFLSCCVLLHWWACCLFPSCILPTLPLWFALWLKLLRDPLWRQELLVHEATAPLNEEGFKMVAALNSSDYMCTWIQRLINDRGGKVKDSKELAEFAKLTFRDGQPALYFDPLISELKEKSWISQNRKERRCSDGHVLESWGSGSYSQQHIWSCQGRSSDCLLAGRACAGLHLGVNRYHCRSCQTDLCKECTDGEKELSLLDTALPLLGLEGMKDTVSDAQEAVKRIRDGLFTAAHHMEGLLMPDANVWTIYVCSISMSLVLAGIAAFAGDLISQIIHLVFQALCLIVGTTVLAQNTAWARRLVTVCRANWDFLSARELQARGSCMSWAFYSPLSQQ